MWRGVQRMLTAEGVEPHIYYVHRLWRQHVTTKTGNSVLYASICCMCCHCALRAPLRYDRGAGYRVQGTGYRVCATAI